MLPNISKLYGTIVHAIPCSLKGFEKNNGPRRRMTTGVPCLLDAIEDSMEFWIAHEERVPGIAADIII
jgi:hypothetical protein